MEAEVAEVGFWATNYQRRHDPEDKDLLFTKLGNVKSQLEKYATLRQTANDRQAIGETVTGAVAEVENEIGAVLGLDDEIRAVRQRFIDLRVLMDELLDKEIQVLARENLEAPRRHAEQAVAHVLAQMQYLIPLYAIAAIVAAGFLIRLLLQPIRQLMTGVKSVAGGNLGQPVYVTHNDEFADLAHGFNQMAQQLRTTTVSRDQLERREEELRRTVDQFQQEIKSVNGRRRNDYSSKWRCAAVRPYQRWARWWPASRIRCAIPCSGYRRLSMRWRRTLASNRIITGT